MVNIKIYKNARVATQSGTHAAQYWYLVFEPTSFSTLDPLMGWGGGCDTRQQVRIRFDHPDKARAFAASQGWHVTECQEEVESFNENKIIPKSYAENYQSDRKFPWTH